MTVFILTMSSIDVEGKNYGIHREECYSDINRTKEEKHKWVQNFLDDYDTNVVNITDEYLSKLIKKFPFETGAISVNYFREYLLVGINYMLQNADPNNEYVYVSWF